MWFNAYNDIIFGIKVPHPLLLNVKLNAILLKTGHFKQILGHQEVLINMNKFPRIVFLNFGVSSHLVAMVTIQSNVTLTMTK